MQSPAPNRWRSTRQPIRRPCQPLPLPSAAHLPSAALRSGGTSGCDRFCRSLRKSLLWAHPSAAGRKGGRELRRTASSEFRRRVGVGAAGSRRLRSLPPILGDGDDMNLRVGLGALLGALRAEFRGCDSDARDLMRGAGCLRCSIPVHVLRLKSSCNESFPAS